MINLFALAFAVTSEQAVILVLVVVVAALLAGFLYRKDTEKENRRRAALDISSTLSAWGFKRFSTFFANYGIGDYSGMVAEIIALGKLASSQKDLVGELREVMLRMIEHDMKDGDQRKVLFEKVEKLFAANDPDYQMVKKAKAEAKVETSFVDPMTGKRLTPEGLDRVGVDADGKAVANPVVAK